MFLERFIFQSKIKLKHFNFCFTDKQSAKHFNGLGSTYLHRIDRKIKILVDLKTPGTEISYTASPCCLKVYSLTCPYGMLSCRKTRHNQRQKITKMLVVKRQMLPYWAILSPFGSTFWRPRQQTFWPKSYKNQFSNNDIPFSNEICTSK